MKASLLGLFALILLAAASACRSNKPVDVINVMTVTPVCDSAPARPDPNESGPTLPSQLTLTTDHAIVMGTVEEEVSRRPLRGAVIDVRLAGSTTSGNRSSRQVYSDRTAGFVVDLIPPGVYSVRARFIGHQPVERMMTLIAGRVDTIRFAMRLYICAGY